mgnify:CR=1 FL=1
MSKDSLTSGKWYWSKRGSDERNGPISGEKLKELAEKGDLEPEDLVWTEGMDGWEKASSVESVQDFFVSPPPLPEDPVEESGNQEEAPPPLPQGEKPETQEEYSFPVRFEVEWGTSFASCKADLHIYERKIRIKPKSSFGSSFYEKREIKHSDYKIKNIRNKKLVFREERGLSVPIEDTIFFKNYVDRSRATDVIRYADNKKVTVGSYDDENKFKIKWGYLMKIDSVLEIGKKVIKISSKESEKNIGC